MPSLASPSRKFSKKERSLTSRLARSLARPAAHSTFAVEAGERLYWAARDDDASALRLHLSEGAPADWRLPANGHTPLIAAAYNDSVECVRWGGEGLVYTASRDRSIKVWAVDEQESGQAAAAGKLVRTLQIMGLICRVGPRSVGRSVDTFRFWTSFGDLLTPRTPSAPKNVHQPKLSLVFIHSKTSPGSAAADESI